MVTTTKGIRHQRPLQTHCTWLPRSVAHKGARAAEGHRKTRLIKRWRWERLWSGVRPQPATDLRLAYLEQLLSSVSRADSEKPEHPERFSRTKFEFCARFLGEGNVRRLPAGPPTPSGAARGRASGRALGQCRRLQYSAYESLPAGGSPAYTNWVWLWTNRLRCDSASPGHRAVPAVTVPP